MSTAQISLHNVVCQVDGNIVSDMNGEKVMLSVQNGKYYNLGSVGGEIWGNIKEPIAIHMLVSKLTELYDVNQRACEVHTINFISQLMEQGLVKVVK